MSLFHFHAKVVSRKKIDLEMRNKKPTNAVRSAAYRHCTDFSSFTNSKCDFSRKNHIVTNWIQLPQGKIKQFKNWLEKNEIFKTFLKSPTEPIELKFKLIAALVWSEVEKVEKRVDSQLFREIEVALQHDLRLDENIKILREFIDENFTSSGMLADVTIHDNRKNGTGGLHAHIMLTLRDINTTDGYLFGKKNRSWNDQKNVDKWRKSWAEINNKYLPENKKITNLSYLKLSEEVLKTDIELANAYRKLNDMKIIHKPYFEYKKSEPIISEIRKKFFKIKEQMIKTQEKKDERNHQKRNTSLKNYETHISRDPRFDITNRNRAKRR